MKQDFLHKIAQELVAEYGKDMAQALIILPNRRSAVFLRKAISDQISGPVLLPRMASIQDQVEAWSGARIISPTELLLRFYNVYRSSSNAPDHSLTNFLRWAGMFLSDIDEVDLELVNSDHLFEHLLSAERIATWNVGDQGPSEFQQRHLKFVERFKQYYSVLVSSLRSDGLAYRGMAYRKVVEELNSILETEARSKVWFVGFNALHTSEKRLIKAFLDEGIGRCFWDADSTYLNDGNHEAGKFLRQNKRAGLMNNGLNWESNDLADRNRSVNIFSAKGTTGQVSAAARLLLDMASEPGFQPLRTAIVLNDESQLMPLLHAIPKGDIRFNITLGYPIRLAVINQFLDALFRMHLGAKKYGGKFHYRDVLRVLRHPCTTSLDRETIKQAIDVASSQVHVNSKDLQLGQKLGWLTQPISGSKDALELIRSAIETFDKEDADGVEVAIISELNRILVELKTFLSEAAFNLEEIQLLWRQLVRSTSISFAGEPLEGVQVMGMLETRLLDFDKVIMIGCNEGTLPRSSTPQTFIPFDIRKAFGMQTHLEKDAVFSYHFYRLLQRASQVDLLFDGNTESFGKGEASRFLKQLIIEKLANSDVQEVKIDSGQGLVQGEFPISVVKGDFELGRIKEYLERGISPSGINTYSRCRLKFYYQYVLSLGEESELAENIDHADFGTVVHDALEKLYEPLVGEPLREQDLQALLLKSESQTEASFKNKMNAQSTVDGKNLLALSVAKKYVERAIKSDINHLANNGEESLTIVATEGSADVDLGSFKLKGTVDRIDRTKDGNLRILDYKTGKVETSELKLGMVEELLDDSPSSKALQLLSYGLLIPDTVQEFEAVSLGIIPLRSSGEPMLLDIGKEKHFDHHELKESAKSLIDKLVARIADPDSTFEQCEDLRICNTCSYAGICSR